MFQLNTVSSFRVRLSDNRICMVRYPTDAEWADRQRKLKLLRTPLGRDRFISEIPHQVQIDAHLFARICVEPPEDFDEYDMAEVVNIIDSCEVIRVEREEGHYRVHLTDAKQEMTHLLRVPRQRQKIEYWRAAGRTIGGKRTEETTMRLEPSAELYDSIAVSSEGYAGAVPITHKHAAVRVVLDQLAEIGGVEIDDPEAKGLGGSAA